jgi:hypothetical protein
VCYADWINMAADRVNYHAFFEHGNKYLYQYKWSAWLLGSRVRIPLGAWMCLYVVLSCVGRGLCDGLITHPEESYRVSVCV